MNNFLKNHPMSDGYTKFCNKSNHLVKNFGKYPFKEGKLSTSETNLGLPNNVKSPTTIEQTMPNLNIKNGPLPRPYGPRNNIETMRLFGKKSRKNKKSKKIKKNKKSKKFGTTTPGTESWKSESKLNNNFSNITSKSAVSGSLNPALGYSNIGTKLSPNKQGNLPANYSNNNLNSPYFNFGKKLTKSFGPNVVGYEKPIPFYNAGGNTINFSTGKLFNPNIVPNNTVNVLPDGITENSWLSQVKSKIKNSFGNIYSPIGEGSGRKVYSQPKPSYGFGSGNGSSGKKKKLTASFGGSVITLNTDGKITITKS
jgi:hypothetical protein